MLAPWKKSCEKPRQLIKKQRHHSANKGLYSQNYGFPTGHIWMWELNHKKAERWKTDAFELWCWRTLLRVPWTARRSKQSILKEINSEYSSEGLMLKLKLQSFGHLMWRANSLEKTWCEKDWGQEEKGTAEDEIVEWNQQLSGREFEQTPGYSEGVWCAAVHGVAESDVT